MNEKNEHLFYRPLNSHGFTVCHTFSLAFSRSHGRFFISHDFSNSQFSKKTNQAAQSLVKKNIVALSSTYKKIDNSVIFDSETFTWSSPGSDVS